MTIYNKKSPYYNTLMVNNYLDVMTFRDIPKEKDDILFEVTSTYEHRPDLLAYDLYRDQQLWWVFAVRNRAIIKDPVFDLVAGVKIYLPKATTLQKVLGV